jgi:O-antigen/teichoic acid export membrane protein
VRADRSTAGSSGLVARFASNALRQAIGAGLFFATTLLLSHALGIAGYGEYFVNWNLAQILVAAVSFGLYNDTIRRLAHGEPPRSVLLGLIVPHLIQLAALALTALMLRRFSSYDAQLVFLIAAATTSGTLLTAVSLGLDEFRVFAIGELLNNLALLALVAIWTPESPGELGWLYVAATSVKSLFYIGSLRRGYSSAHPDATQGQCATIGDGRRYALLAYGHSLLQITTFRGLVLASGYLLPPGGMGQLAVIWAFCDRALTLVQGINQILYPRLMMASVSMGFRLWTNVSTSAAYVVTVSTLVVSCIVLGRLGVITNLRIEYPALLLCVALVPHVVRLLKMTEALAESRFTDLFASHAIAVLASSIAFVLFVQLNLTGLWVPPALIFIASSAGLVALYRVR